MMVAAKKIVFANVLKLFHHRLEIKYSLNNKKTNFVAFLG